MEWELAAAAWSGMAFHGGGCRVSAAVFGRPISLCLIEALIGFD